MALTLAIAEAKLQDALDALDDSLAGDVEIKDRKSKPATLGELQDAIDYWNKKCLELGAQGTRTGRRVRGATQPG